MRCGLLTSYELDDRGKLVQIPSEAKDCSLFHIVQTGYGAHPAINLRLSKDYSSEVKLQENTRFQQAPMLRKRGPVSPVADTFSWRYRETICTYVKSMWDISEM